MDADEESEAIISEITRAGWTLTESKTQPAGGGFYAVGVKRERWPLIMLERPTRVEALRAISDVVAKMSSLSDEA